MIKTKEGKLSKEADYSGEMEQCNICKKNV